MYIYGIEDSSRDCTNLRSCSTAAQMTLPFLVVSLRVVVDWDSCTLVVCLILSYTLILTLSWIQKYRITKRVGGGSFGDIYLGVGANGEKVSLLSVVTCLLSLVVCRLSLLLVSRCLLSLVVCCLSLFVVSCCLLSLVVAFSSPTTN